MRIGLRFDIFYHTFGFGLNGGILKGRLTMRKMLLSVFGAMVVIALTFSVSFAADKMTGKIKSMDAAKGTVVFCPGGTKTDMNLKADPAMLKQKMIKEGNVVNIVLDEKDKTMIKKISKSATVPVGC